MSGYTPVPVTNQILARYIAYLAKKLKFSSLCQYLNIVRILHLEQGLPNPLKDNFHINLTLKGVKRALGNPVHQKLPITPDILLKIKPHLNLSHPEDALFWAAALAAFFGMLRRSNLLHNPPFDSNKHLRRCDIRLFPWGLALRIRWSKTIQFQDRELLVPLPALTNHPLDPVGAMINFFNLSAGAPDLGPALVLPNTFRPLSPIRFAGLLKGLIKKIGLDPLLYSGHSFRRGGATWAMKNHFPADVIKLMGDWKSDAYMAYVDLPLQSRVKYAKNFATSLPHYS